MAAPPTTAAAALGLRHLLGHPLPVCERDEHERRILAERAGALAGRLPRAGRRARREVLDCAGESGPINVEMTRAPSISGSQ
jgi:hypothetical protein